MPRSQLTEQYQRVMSLVEQLHALAEDERNFILDLLVPLPEQPEVKKPTKRASKKSSSPQREYDHCLRCGTTKRDSSHKDTSSPDYHEFQSSKDIDFCARCKGASYVHPIHHDETLGGYHPFESSKKPSKSASKSSRASGMAAAIAKSLSHGKPTGEGPICKICSYAEDYEDHSQPSPHYHPFEPSGSAAPPARGRSSTNGGATTSTQNIETEKDAVGVAVGGSSES